MMARIICLRRKLFRRITNPSCLIGDFEVWLGFLIGCSLTSSLKLAGGNSHGQKT